MTWLLQVNNVFRLNQWIQRMPRKTTHNDHSSSTSLHSTLLTNGVHSLWSAPHSNTTWKQLELGLMGQRHTFPDIQGPVSVVMRPSDMNVILSQCHLFATADSSSQMPLVIIQDLRTATVQSTVNGYAFPVHT